MEEINEKLHLQMLDFDKEKRTKWMKERKPFSVLFEVTPRCNMNCIHCYLKIIILHTRWIMKELLN